MRTYVSHIILTYVPHNKAEKALVDEIKKMEHRVVREKEVDDYKKEFNELIQKINSSYPRCKDIELVIWSYGSDGGDINFRTDVAHLVLFWGLEPN